MFYCYKRYIGVRRHSTGEMLWVAPKENELICSRFPEKEVVIAYHYYAGAERGKYDGEELICSVDCCGQYGTNTYPRGEYHVGVYNVPCLKEIFAIVFPLIFRIKTAAEHNGMDMRMEIHRTSPCMQDAYIANVRPEILFVRSQLA